MKKQFISIICLISILAFLVGCATTPGFKEYSPKATPSERLFPGKFIVETEWLANNSDSPKLRLIDYGRKDTHYLAGHIPGAVFIERKAFWDEVDGIPGMLPPLKSMVATLEQAGVSTDSIVVIYDSNSGLWASRLFWALEFLGHQDVYILIGGIIQLPENFKR